MRISLSSKNLILFCLCLALCALFAWFVHQHVAVALTGSLRYTLFYISDRANTPMRNGDYVVFTLDNPIVADLKVKRVIKEASCVAGQQLKEDHKEYFCNGYFLGKAKGTSLKGEKVENFKFNGIVPKGFLFVMGHSKDSFDSRYFGFISVDKVEKIAWPLL